MFFLALQFGGQTGDWKTAQVIGLLSGAGVDVIVFLLWLKRRNDRALVPPYIICQRSVAASCALAFFIYSTLLVQVYYLPIWFQAIKGDSAVASGGSYDPLLGRERSFLVSRGHFRHQNRLFCSPGHSWMCHQCCWLCSAEHVASKHCIAKVDWI